MKWNSPTFCELCCKKLVGIAEINSTIEADDIVVVTVKESKVIDWVLCRVCQSIICKEFCFDNQVGLCKPCANDYSIQKNYETNLFESTREQKQTDDILSSELVF